MANSTSITPLFKKSIERQFEAEKRSVIQKHLETHKEAIEEEITNRLMSIVVNLSAHDYLSQNNINIIIHEK